jgi:hypothetical protein
MSINPISNSTPPTVHAASTPKAATAPSPAAAAAAPKAQAAAPKAQAASPKAQAASSAVKAVSAAVQEANESPAQTLKEAASGDRQAQKLLHHGSPVGTVVNTKV